MAVNQVRAVLRQMQSAGVLPAGHGISDGQLLEHYLTQQSEVAFEAILRRHGGMVLGVCRRVLGNPSDAEDAFQATFLVLVRKASSIAPRNAVGNWLYGVAYRTSMKARSMNAKRRLKERTAMERMRPATRADGGRCDLQEVLDQELSRLPDKYRAPLVLCDLEGKTRAEAACQLGCPEGTVATRLVKARALLAKALTRRGIALAGGGAALVLTQSAAALPLPLLLSTLKAASAFAAGSAAVLALVPAQVVALTEGVLKTMSTNTMKTCVALLFATGILAFSGLMPLAWPQVGPSSQEWTDVLKASQPGSGTAFLEVGKKYEFTPTSKWAVFQAKVVAIRGDQWVRVVEMQMEGSNNLGPTWVNLHQMAFISEIAAEGNKNQRDLLKK